MHRNMQSGDQQVLMLGTRLWSYKQDGCPDRSLVTAKTTRPPVYGTSGLYSDVQMTASGLSTVT